MPRVRRPLVPIVSALLVAVACGGVGTESTPLAPVDTLALRTEAATYWPEASWRRAEPGAMGMDAGVIASLGRRVRNGEMPGLHSFVVIRFGHVVLEAHAPGTDGARAHTLQSVTKSVGSLLAGIAVDDGVLSLDRRVLDVYGDLPDIVAVDAFKSALTVRHLLEMRTGMAFWESPYPGSPLQQLNDSRGDWARFVLDRPMSAAPGTTWSYNSGGVILLGSILQRVTGAPLDRFARDRLFAPLGIVGEQWARSPYDGLPHLGGGLSLAPLDAARVGYLVLRRGRWRTAQVVSASWIEGSTRTITRGVAAFGGRPTDYGLLWWPIALTGAAGEAWDDRVIAASGAMGQWIFVVPRHDLVVVATGGAQGADAFRAVQAFFDEVLPAVR